MAKYIDSEKIVLKYEFGLMSDEGIVCIPMRDVKKSIAATPAADVVKVTRCDECAHWGGVTYGFVCRKFSGIETKICMHADDYCSYGERSAENV